MVLRPARYYVTKDDYIIFSSEVGVIDVEPENVLYKDRLSPGKMLLIDLEEGRIISDEEIKSRNGRGTAISTMVRRAACSIR